jgi:5-methylcytosine-specific restriction protein A
VKLCTVCGVATSRAGSRCTVHARQSNRSRHNALYSTRAWQRLSERVLRAWRGEHGNWCPGYQRRAHPAVDLTVDHVVPLAAGGAPFDIGNTAVLCRSCNSTKGASTSRGGVAHRGTAIAADWRHATVCTRPSFANCGGFSPVGCCMTADALEAMAASATMALRASLAPSRHCPACGAALPYLAGRGRPRRWCDAHNPRPLRLRPRAAPSAKSGALTPALACSSAERKKGPGWRAEPQCRLAAALPGLLGGLNRSAGRSSCGTRPR